MPPPRCVATTFSFGSFFEHTADNEPRHRQRAVHRAADRRREPVIAHALLAKADRRRVDDHWHVKFTRQLEERKSVVVVRIAALQARQDPAPLRTVLFHGALEFAQERIAAIRHNRRHAVDFSRIFVLLCRDVPVLPLTALELLARSMSRMLWSGLEMTEMSTPPILAASSTFSMVPGGRPLVAPMFL